MTEADNARLPLYRARLAVPLLDAIDDPLSANWQLAWRRYLWLRRDPSGGDAVVS